MNERAAAGATIGPPTEHTRRRAPRLVITPHRAKWCAELGVRECEVKRIPDISND